MHGLMAIMAYWFRLPRQCFKVQKNNWQNKNIIKSFGQIKFIVRFLFYNLFCPLEILNQKMLKQYDSMNNAKGIITLEKSPMVIGSDDNCDIVIKVGNALLIIIILFILYNRFRDQLSLILPTSLLTL